MAPLVVEIRYYYSTGLVFGVFFLSTDYNGKFEEAEPLQRISIPLSFEGEEDRGGEVDKMLCFLAMTV